MRRTKLFCLVLVFALPASSANGGGIKATTIEPNWVETEPVREKGGDNVSVLTETIGRYYPGISFKVSHLEGNSYKVSGTGGSQTVVFSPETIRRLNKMNKNPASGDSLLSVCPSQAEGIRRAMTVPAVKTAKSSYCPSGDCWPRNPRGEYTTLTPYKGVRVVYNAHNDKFPVCSASYKLEYHSASLPGWPYGTGWGPTIVIRNAGSCDPVTLIRDDGVEYLRRVLVMKNGQPGREGESCFEKTILSNGSGESFN